MTRVPWWSVPARESTLSPGSLARSHRVHHILVAPGNAGTARSFENVPVAATDLDGLSRLVRT